MRVTRFSNARALASVIAVSVAALGATIALAGCGSSNGSHPTSPAVFDSAARDLLPPAALKRGVLTVATDASYPPAEFFASDGHTIQGYDADVAQAIGRVFGVKVRLYNQDWDALFGELAPGKADFLISDVNDTRPRERSMQFVDYFSAGTAIVVQHGNPEHIGGIGSLCGHTLGAESATVQVDEIAAVSKLCGNHPIKTKTYVQESGAMLDLRVGRLDGVLCDYPVAASFIAKTTNAPYYALATKTQYDRGYVGIAIRKDNPQLVRAIQAAVQHLIQIGAYKQILRDWNVEDGAIATATINGAAKPGLAASE
jgi:polar amino acid transport system substrate-binding protein